MKLACDGGCPEGKTYIGKWEVVIWVCRGPGVKPGEYRGVAISAVTVGGWLSYLLTKVYKVSNT